MWRWIDYGDSEEKQPASCRRFQGPASQLPSPSGVTKKDLRNLGDLELGRDNDGWWWVWSISPRHEFFRSFALAV